MLWIILKVWSGVIDWQVKSLVTKISHNTINMLSLTHITYHIK